MAEVTMPRLSDTMAEGAVSRWLKQPGDQVEHGEIIAEIETDKAVMELMAFESGTLQNILVPEGQTVAIGAPIALIGEGMPEAATMTAPASGSHQVPMEERVPTSNVRTIAEARAEVQPAPAAELDKSKATTERIKASPVARQMAMEHGIDLRQVQGTGPGGRIIKDNVEEFVQRAGHGSPALAIPAVPPAASISSVLAASQAVPAVPGRPMAVPSAYAFDVVPMSRMRQAVARAMSESKPGVPHIYVTSEIDMTAALKLRQEINTSDVTDVPISINDLVVKAAAKALRAFPMLNTSYATSAAGQPGVIQHDEINISVAIALNEGLIAPVVRTADRQDLNAIASQIKDLAARARAGQIKQQELEGATFQVSNLGMLDVLAFVSIITPPQVASLAVGTIRRVPMIRDDGQVGTAEHMLVVLSVDHRVVDGATAARYLQELKRLLQSPLRVIV